MEQKLLFFKFVSQYINWKRDIMRNEGKKIINIGSELCINCNSPLKTEREIRH